MTMRVGINRVHLGLARKIYVLLGAASIVLAVSFGATAPARAATPAHTDVMFLFDTSGSMGPELQEAKEEMLKVIGNVNATLPDVHYGVAEVRDYPFGEVLGEAELEASSEKPWKLDQPVTSDLSAVQKAIEPLAPFGGGDLPESYGRALWETDTNPNVGWREGAQHVIILVADNVPHDNNLNEGLPESVWAKNEETGLVENPFNTHEELPGKWGIPGTAWAPSTNLDFQTTMTQLALDGKPLEDVDFSGEVGYLPYWEYWASLSGGHALGAKSTELAAKITTLIETGAATALPPCPAEQVRNGAGVCVPFHATATQVVCNLVIATATDACTATVGDAAPTGSTNPTGAVAFVSTSGGVFSSGNTCSLTPTPLSPNTSSCSVQFVPPATPTSLPAITATYAGDTTHKGSSGQTHYGTTGELATHVELSELGTIKPGGVVEVPVGCGFPCALSGEITSPPGASLASASLSSVEVAAASAHGKKKKAKRKPLVLGKGTLKLSQAGKGTLKIKLTAKGKRALAHVKGKGVRVTLKVTISTLDGRLVAVETRHLKVVAAKKKAHHKHH
jgi:hypothetical protein